MGLLWRGSRVVDPANGRDEVCDLLIEDGRIADVGQELESSSHRVIDLAGLVTIPGVVDCHVHVTNWLGGPQGYRMMARAGTVTAIDMAGPFDELVANAPGLATGLNVGGLESIRPGQNVRSDDPSRDEIRRLVRESQASGALGIKILGGHFPLTPEATSRAIQVANEEDAYVAFHVGTTSWPRSDLRSFKQAVELAGTNRVHICHVCTCCLGLVLGDPIAELSEMLAILEKRPNVSSESHLSITAYSFAQIEDGRPLSLSTRMFLEIGGYQADTDGVKRALSDGYACVVVPGILENSLAFREQAASEWEAGQVRALGFRANLPVSLLTCALHKGGDGSFVVDALATDGGGIPRNNLLRSGSLLVRLGAMTLSDLATKISLAPARMFGLSSKGHLSVGADADVSAFDPMTGEAVFTLARGRPVLENSEPVGSGFQLISTERIDPEHGLEGTTMSSGFGSIKASQ